MTGWTLGQAIWSYYQVFANIAIPSPSAADIGYFTLPVFAFVAMLRLMIDANLRPAGQPQVLAARLRFGLVVVLDGLVVAGSMFIIAWITVLAATVRASGPTTLEFGVALAYPLTDLILATIVLLLLLAYRVAPPYRTQLSLLGLGLIAIAVSDSFFTYAVSSGADTIPPIYDSGFIAGPVLIALAATATAVNPRFAGIHRPPHTKRPRPWVPYMLGIAAGLLILAKTAAGRSLDSAEIYAGLLVIVLVMVRQLVVLVDLAAKRLSEKAAARSRDAFRAAANQAVTAFERPTPPLETSLEDEIADISSTLTQTVGRLGQISRRAQAFEIEVKNLVNRAEAARAIAKLNEEDASKIATLLGIESEQRLRVEIDKLAVEHNRQIDLVRDSSRKVAVWTFLGGIFFGVVGNVVVALVVR